MARLPRLTPVAVTLLLLGAPARAQPPEDPAAPGAPTAEPAAAAPVPEPAGEPAPEPTSQEPPAAPGSPDDAPPAPTPGASGKKPPPEPEQFLSTPVLPPLGAAGRRTVPTRRPPLDPNLAAEYFDEYYRHFQPRPDRWRIGVPEWRRYPGGRARGAPFRRGRWWDPFNQNVLKADYPILGNDKFFELQVISDTIFNHRRAFLPSGVSASTPGRFGFFGRGHLLAVDQTFFISGEFFRGDTAFKPKDWAVRVTPAVNVNYLRSRERGIVNVDVREGTTRTDVHVGFQELFFEKKLRDLGPHYDFLSSRTGIQQFNADFRGFLFFDNAPGVRLFGSAKANEIQYNLAYFRPLNKDTYSRLNTLFEDRGQDVFIANIYRQDLLRPGYTAQLIGAFNNDHGDELFDNDGIRRRPALLGDAEPHKVRAYYLGLNGDGHFGRINISHSFYQAWGVDTHNPIAGRRVHINAQMAAAELSYDRDWARLRASLFYTSGDRRPRDRVARGFDAIFDSPFFGGGPFSLYNAQRQALAGSFVDLFGEASLLPTLRGSRLEGQANFVNTGVLIVNFGADVELTPKWRAVPNVNFINLVHTEPLELVLNQAGIRRGLGIEYSLGFRYRPYLNDNVVLVFGASALQPRQGFKDIFQNKTLYSLFTRLSLAF